MKWYEYKTGKKRLISEKSALDSHPEYKRFNFCKLEDNNLACSGCFNYNGKVYCVFLIYPPLYPEVRPVVFLQEVEKSGDLKQVKGWHNAENILCLFNHYPNEWSREFNSVDILDRVKQYLSEGRFNKENLWNETFLINENIYVFPEGLVSDDTLPSFFNYHFVRDKLFIVSKLTSLVDNQESYPAIELPFLDNDSDKSIGVFCIIDQGLNDLEPININRSAIRYVYNNSSNQKLDDIIKRLSLSFPLPVVFFNTEKNQLRAYSYAKRNSDCKVERASQIRVYQDIFSRIKLMSELNSLKEKTVTIVGLGAVGSVSAIELARSGVKNFNLIDFDRLSVENIGRHACTLSDLDKFKVNVIAEKILEINPSAVIRKFKTNILSEAKANEIDKALDKSDIVLSSIDQEEAKDALNALCISKNKPMVFANVFYDAVGGIILIVLPHLGGCFCCLKEHLTKDVEDGKMPDFNKLVEGKPEPGCRTPVFPGASIDTHTISLIAAKITKNILLNRYEKDENDKIVNVYFVGNQELKYKDSNGNLKSFFEGLLDIKKAFKPIVRDCPICESSSKLSSTEEKSYSDILSNIKSI